MSIWTELLFHHGHVADVDQARALAEAPPVAPASGAAGPTRHGTEAGQRSVPCQPVFPGRGVASLCAIALSAFR